MANRDNPAKGSAFEKVASRLFGSNGVELVPHFPLEVGISRQKRVHKFDLGARDPAILIECKAHTWTEGDNSPSAKLAVWNEAMYWFLVAPRTFRKILFVQRSERRSQSLGQHYLARYSHMIPDGVELWESALDGTRLRCIHGDRRAL